MDQSTPYLCQLQSSLQTCQSQMQIISGLILSVSAEKDRNGLKVYSNKLGQELKDK